MHHRARHFTHQSAQIGLHFTKPFGKGSQFIIVELLHIDAGGEITRGDPPGLFQQRHHRIADLTGQQPGNCHNKTQRHQTDNDAHGSGTAVERLHIFCHLGRNLVIDFPQAEGFCSHLLQRDPGFVFAQTSDSLQIASSEGAQQLVMHRKILGPRRNHLLINLFLFTCSES